MDETLRKQRALQPMKTFPRPGPADSTPAARSFEQIFLEHWDAIYRLLVRMTGDPAEAEDLALETFFRLHRHPPQEGESYNPGGWLYRVATNLGLRSIRSFKRREKYELRAGIDVLEAAPENRPAVLFEKKEQDRLAHQALAKMNPRRAELLVLRYSGMAYKDIAEVLGLSPTSIGPLLLRAEREFAKVYRALDQEEEV
jgi:RNA polymerase sigma-70 factor (ECF subfamily)